MAGKDRVGLMHIHQSAALVADLVKQVKQSSKHGDSEVVTKEYQQSYSLAVWSAFMVRTHVAAPCRDAN